MKIKNTDYSVTRNACKLCTPLGACLAFKGIEESITLLHGSQGCSTYIRRYMISHFKEPIDIASSNFSEDTAVFGGGDNLKQSIKNLIYTYNPKFIGIATTCLSETIGDDVNLILNELYTENPGMEFPEMVAVSTASYRGTHITGFHDAIVAIVKKFAKNENLNEKVNLFPGMISAEDIRYLKRVFNSFELETIILPDYSETLDGGMWSEYHKIPEGGTTIESIRETGGAKATVEFSGDFSKGISSGAYLEDEFNVKNYSIEMPVGIKLTDKFFNVLRKISGKEIPQEFLSERNRLIDSYADGHKYIFGKRAFIYGEEEFVISVAAFLSEIGIIPVLCASGGKSGSMQKSLPGLIYNYENLDVKIEDGLDFVDIDEYVDELKPDILIGNSKGYKTSRKYEIPMLRIGFPIHDRFGGQRILHLGYGGTQRLFDDIVNIFIEEKQKKSPVGYTYI